MFRVATSTLDCTVHTEGALSSIVGLALPTNSNDLFATIDFEGTV